MIIELSHSSTKFKSTLVKPYFIDNQEPIPDSPISTQVPSAKTPSTKTGFLETLQTEISLVNIISIKLVAKSSLATLAFLALI